jgi:FAD synthase
VQVEFVAKIRDETRFDSLDALKRQIELDVQAVAAIFGQRAADPAALLNINKQ